MTTKKSIWDKTVDRVFSAEAELEACENTLQGAAMEIDRLKRAERNARALASKWRTRCKKAEENIHTEAIGDYDRGRFDGENHEKARSATRIAEYQRLLSVSDGEKDRQIRELENLVQRAQFDTGFFVVLAVAQAILLCAMAVLS